MRLLYIFLITSLLSSCAKKDKENINKTKVTSITKVKKETSKGESKFILTEKNSMDFFLEYDKLHKENVVELDTDMGKIEITLLQFAIFVPKLDKLVEILTSERPPHQDLPPQIHFDLLLRHPMYLKLNLKIIG